MTNSIIQSLICLQLQQKKKIKHVQELDENKSFPWVFRTFFGNIVTFVFKIYIIVK